MGGKTQRCLGQILGQPRPRDGNGKDVGRELMRIGPTLSRTQGSHVVTLELEGYSEEAEIGLFSTRVLLERGAGH